MNWRCQDDIISALGAENSSEGRKYREILIFAKVPQGRQNDTFHNFTRMYRMNTSFNEGHYNGKNAIKGT